MPMSLSDFPPETQQDIEELAKASDDTIAHMDPFWARIVKGCKRVVQNS